MEIIIFSLAFIVGRYFWEKKYLRDRREAHLPWIALAVACLITIPFSNVSIGWIIVFGSLLGAISIFNSRTLKVHYLRINKKDSFDANVAQLILMASNISKDHLVMNDRTLYFKSFTDCRLASDFLVTKENSSIYGDRGELADGLAMLANLPRGVKECLADAVSLEGTQKNRLSMLLKDPSPMNEIYVQKYQSGDYSNPLS